MSDTALRYWWVVKYELTPPGGYRKLSVTINGRTPSPTISAYQGDLLVIEVTNGLGKEDLAIQIDGVRPIGGASTHPIRPGETFAHWFFVDQVSVALIWGWFAEVCRFDSRDSEELEKGDQISPMLMEAIEESHIAVIVFSEDYASSWWCLEELAKIMECKEQGNLTVLPVFYKVDPREVREGRESYRRALDKHESKFGKDSDKVKRWKEALFNAGSLFGWHLNDGDESKHIQEIVKWISNHLDCMPLHVAKHPVGIESQVVMLKSMLNLESNDDVVMVGLWGQGGEGKWFGNGSRIIITTRDKHLLTCQGIYQDHVYEVKALDDSQARELLSKHASQTHQIRIDLVNGALNYAKGLPLALEVLGSLLFGETEDVWESTLIKLSESRQNHQ
ncbi:TMV resistance protein N-like [Eucalyptus grandis]|uniref:TMV resistance protein N-like n=1 Tax=Eucalyptus grandis TaxID=71139 RepID=UPI00192E93C7|nr:TMV resistance protein N-like [Eucalyptus grandis]